MKVNHDKWNSNRSVGKFEHHERTDIKRRKWAEFDRSGQYFELDVSDDEPSEALLDAYRMARA